MKGLRRLSAMMFGAQEEVEEEVIVVVSSRGMGPRRRSLPSQMNKAQDSFGEKARRRSQTQQERRRQVIHQFLRQDSFLKKRTMKQQQQQQQQPAPQGLVQGPLPRPPPVRQLQASKSMPMTKPEMQETTPLVVQPTLNPPPKQLQASESFTTVSSETASCSASEDDVAQDTDELDTSLTSSEESAPQHTAAELAAVTPLPGKSIRWHPFVEHNQKKRSLKGQQSGDLPEWKKRQMAHRVHLCNQRKAEWKEFQKDFLLHKNRQEIVVAPARQDWRKRNDRPLPSDYFLRMEKALNKGKMDNMLFGGSGKSKEDAKSVSDTLSVKSGDISIKSDSLTVKSDNVLISNHERVKLLREMSVSVVIPTKLDRQGSF